jgi:glycosyltransferase involved in cell wall biosynthesis
MIKVTALTAFRDDPCSRFRFRQFIEPLAERDIAVSEHYLPITRYRRQPLALLGMLLRLSGVVASRSADITWFRRELIPERVTLEKFTGGKRLFDVDDAIWLNSTTNFSERIIEKCDGVIAGNSFIAEHYKPIGTPVWIVPTVVNTDVWKPAEKLHDGIFRLGWLGTRYNLRSLDLIEGPLAEFLGSYKDARLTLISDAKPQFKNIPSRSLEYIKWSADSEVAATQKFDAGLMPLEDSDWSRGKCAAKMICYLACGVPAIVSPFGVNKDILDQASVGIGAISPSDWYDAFERLYNDRTLAANIGATGREIVEKKYSVTTNVGKLVDIFRNVTGHE